MKVNSDCSCGVPASFGTPHLIVGTVACQDHRVSMGQVARVVRCRLSTSHHSESQSRGSRPSSAWHRRGQAAWPLLGRVRKGKKVMSWFVYILRCSDSSLYCGITTDLDRRFEAHSAGTGTRCHWIPRLAVHLVWFKEKTQQVGGPPRRI